MLVKQVQRNPSRVAAPNSGICFYTGVYALDSFHIYYFILGNSKIGVSLSCIYQCSYNEYISNNSNNNNNDDNNKIAFQSKAYHPQTRTRYEDTILCSALRFVIAIPLNRYVYVRNSATAT